MLEESSFDPNTSKGGVVIKNILSRTAHEQLSGGIPLMNGL